MMSILTDEELVSDLDPILRAHVEDRLAMNPALRDGLEMAALVRLGVFAWEDKS